MSDGESPDFKKLQQDVQRKLEQLRKMKHERDKPEKPIDPAMIRKARELYDSGQFDRRVVKITPDDMHSDRVDLECGHHTWRHRMLVDAFAGRDNSVETCEECAREWIGKQKAE